MRTQIYAFMNNFIKIIDEVRGGETLILESGKVYDVWQDEAIRLKGYYCSNTASKTENENGKRYTALYLKDKKDVIIDGNGATLRIHGVMTPILLDNCEDIVIKNLTIDYARPTMNEFKVVEKIGDEYILQVNEECPFEIEDDMLIWRGEIGKNGNPYWKNPYKGSNQLSMYYNPQTEETVFMKGNNGDSRPSVPTFESVEQIGENVLKVSLKDKETSLPVGCTVQTRNIIRGQVGGFFVRCKNLRLENVSVKAMHGLGLLCQFCDTVTYKGLDCTPKAGRTIASNADFFHFSGCKGKITIEGCKAAGAHDDFVNVHGTYLRVVEQNETEKSVTVRFMHPQTWGFDAFIKGDQIEFVDSSALTSYDKADVMNVERINDTDIKLYLSKHVPSVRINKDVVENVTWTASVLIKNNYFGASMGRGILVSSRKKAVIKNNIFYKNGGTVLLVAGDCNSWFESGTKGNVTFKNNRVVGCSYGMSKKGAPTIHCAPEVADKASETPVHNKISVINNRFEAPPQGFTEIKIRHVKNFVLKKNSFEGGYHLVKKVAPKVINSQNIDK